MQAYPGTYLHGINLNDFYPVHSISICGYLMSPDYVAAIDAGIRSMHKSLRDTPLNEIAKGTFPVGVLTPRSMHVIALANLIKTTGGAGYGVENTRWLTQAEMDDVLRKADIELEFERIRRLVAPDAASRLSCLWVAENSRIGETHIRNMLGNSIYIVTVDIPVAIRVTKVDTDWFDRYYSDPKEEYIKQYWASVPCTSIPKWEFLVEGVVRLTEQRQIDYIKQFGTKIP